MKLLKPLKSIELNHKPTTYFIAALLLIVGVVLCLPWLQASLIPAPLPPADSVVRASPETPDERDIPANTPYTVPADQPRQLRLPSLNKSMFIQKVGVDNEKRIAVPSNINLVGWFVDSVRPGEPGVSIIDGHVSGRYKQGIFADLHKLKKDDKVAVEYGDMSEKVFTVRSTIKISEKFAKPFLFAKQPKIMSQLNLITCAFGKDGKTYSDRVIVSAELDVKLPKPMMPDTKKD